MKEKLTRNFGLKLASLALAFIVWLIVVNISNPEVTRTKTISLEVLNEHIIIDAAKTYDIIGGRTVTVSYNVRALDESKIKASDFSATIDLQKLYDLTGAVPVDIEIINNKELIIGTPQARPGTIKVNTEDIQRKNFVLSAHAVGEPAEGLAVGEIKLNPSSVYINGPVSMIGQISSVGIEVDVSAANDDLSGSAKLILYDANGNKLSIDDTKLVFDNNEVEYTATILRGKSLSLNFEVGGEPAEGYIFTGAESSVKSIQVLGLSSVLEGLSTIHIPASVLNIEGARGNKTIVLDVSEYLPENVTSASNSQVSVTLKVEAVNKRSFELKLPDMEVSGSGPGYVYALVPETIMVIASGLPEELQNIAAADLHAKLNVSNLSEGRHKLNLEFEPVENIHIDSYTPFEVVIFKEGESGPTEEASENQGTAEDSSEEEPDTATESAAETTASPKSSVTGSSSIVPSKPETGGTTQESTQAQGTRIITSEQNTGRNYMESTSDKQRSGSIKHSNTATKSPSNPTKSSGASPKPSAGLRTETSPVPSGSSEP